MFHWALVAMGVFQITFLAVAGFTGAAPDPSKLKYVVVYTVIVGGLVVLMPASFGLGLDELKRYLLQAWRRQIFVLLLIVFVVGLLYVIFLRFPVFDEASIFEASRIVAVEGIGNFFAKYLTISWLGIQHPPLMPLLYGLAMHLFGIDLIVLRLVSLFFTAGTVLLTFWLGSELYNEEIGFSAALLLLTFTYVFRVGAAASNDMPVTFFFILAVFLVVRMNRTPSVLLAAAAGACIGLGLVSKYTMILVFPVLLGYVLAEHSNARIKRYLAITAVVSLTIIATWLAYAYKIGVLGTQVETLSAYARVAVQSRRGLNLVLEWVVARLPSAVGPYDIPLILLGFWQSLRIRNVSDQFIIFWIVFVFLSLLLTLPDTRYFMLMFPALAIVASRGLEMLADVGVRAVLLALLYGAAALYLFVDWHRSVSIFLH